jgi:hypothetical protein
VPSLLDVIISLRDFPVADGSGGLTIYAKRARDSRHRTNRHAPDSRGNPADERQNAPANACTPDAKTGDAAGSADAYQRKRSPAA